MENGRQFLEFDTCWGDSFKISVQKREAYKRGGLKERGVKRAFTLDLKYERKILMERRV